MECLKAQLKGNLQKQKERERQGGEGGNCTSPYPNGCRQRQRPRVQLDCQLPGFFGILRIFGLIVYPVPYALHLQRCVPERLYPIFTWFSFLPLYRISGIACPLLFLFFPCLYLSTIFAFWTLPVRKLSLQREKERFIISA